MAQENCRPCAVELLCLCRHGSHYLVGVRLAAIKDSSVQICTDGPTCQLAGGAMPSAAELQSLWMQLELLRPWMHGSCCILGARFATKFRPYRFAWTGRSCQLAVAVGPCAGELQALCIRIAASLQAWLPLPSAGEARHKVCLRRLDRPHLSVSRGCQPLCSSTAGPAQWNCCVSEGMAPTT